MSIGTSKREKNFTSEKYTAMAMATYVDTRDVVFRLDRGACPIDQVIGELRRAFGGFLVTNDDWFGNARRVLAQLVEKGEKSGVPFLMKDNILSELDAAEKLAGRRKTFSIPINESSTLKGDINCHRLRLISDCPFEKNETARSVIDILQSNGFVAEIRE